MNSGVISRLKVDCEYGSQGRQAGADRNVTSPEQSGCTALRVRHTAPYLQGLLWLQPRLPITAFDMVRREISANLGPKPRRCIAEVCFTASHVYMSSMLQASMSLIQLLSTRAAGSGDSTPNRSRSHQMSTNGTGS